MAAAAEGSLPRPVIEAAVEAVAPAGQALRQLTLALAADPGALSCGAPPVAGRLAAELIARGSATLAIPACAVCGRAGKPLFRGDGGAGCASGAAPGSWLRRLRQLRPGPPGRWPGQLWPGPLRGLPPPGRPAAPPPVRQVREDRPGRGASP